MTEEKIESELSKVLLSNEVCQYFSDFKVFIPVYPTMKAKLLEQEEKDPLNSWDDAQQRKDLAEMAELDAILELFKEAQFKKSQAQEEIKNKTPEFDANWDFVNYCVLQDSNPD